jgi:transcriptional regulator with AAA-type ATPase domain
MLRRLLQKNSPSFLVAVGLVVLAVGGSLAWRWLRPNPHAESEELVRGFVAAATGEVQELRRAVRELAARAEPSRLSETEVALANRREDTRRSLDELAAATQDALDALEGLSLQTLRNRSARLRDRLAATKAYVEEIIADARADLQDRFPSPTPG